MRYLTLSEVLELHRRVIGQSGGALGVLNLSALESVPGSAADDVRRQRLVSFHCGESGSAWLLAYPEPSILGRKQTDRTRSDGSFSIPQ